LGITGVSRGEVPERRGPGQETDDDDVDDDDDDNNNNNLRPFLYFIIQKAVHYMPWS
jgi:hypothetical protein